ncbi:MAG: L,D-transpeptidase family protein [Chlamydiota bacterium]
MNIEQVIFVYSEGWDAFEAKLFRMEKAGGRPWGVVGAPIPVVIGQKGMAWGHGIHPQPLFPGPIKVEGDKRTPAGIFTLGEVFGFGEDFPPKSLKMAHLLFDSERVAVDDPASSLYNQFAFLPGDWKSSERMDHPLYRLGCVVDHNKRGFLPGAGSCIFFHVWRGPKEATAGCTAMAEADLKEVLLWLDPSKHPRLIQLPAFVSSAASATDYGCEKE